MQKSDNNKVAKTVRRRVKSSTTLNRKYVRSPHRQIRISTPAEMQSRTGTNIMRDSVAKSSPKTASVMGHVRRDAMQSPMMMGQTEQGMMQSPMTISRTSQNTMQSSIAMNYAEQNSMQSPMMMGHMKQSMATKQNAARSSMMQTAPQKTQMSAKELKEQAIKKALATASATPKETKVSKKKHKKSTQSIHFGLGRVILALSCAAATVFAIVYFVNLNMPDISLRVAAMQTGINASYPSYVPRDYSVTSITSEDGKVTLDFSNSSTGGAFTLVEETSSWDSNALMTNYVKDAFGENYSVVREQGITLYISGSDAAWVNGGVVYKLTTKSGTLTNKQIKSIAVSL